MDLPTINEIKKTNYTFGDPSANSGGKIHTPNTNNAGQCPVSACVAANNPELIRIAAHAPYLTVTRSS